MELLEVAIRLGAEIESLRRELKRKETELRQVLNTSSEATRDREVQSPSPDKRADKEPVGTKIRRLLESHPGREYTLDEISAQLGIEDRLKIRKTLFRLKEEVTGFHRSGPSRYVFRN